MELLLTSFGVLAVIAAWSAWRRTSLDWTRDDLFDLRDETREWFLKSGHGLDHMMYRRLRDMINSDLRYTKSARLSSLLWIYFRVPKGLSLRRSAELDGFFDTSDEELRQFIRHVRNASTRAIQRYMLTTSFTLVVAVIVLLPVMVLMTIHDGVTHLYKNIKASIISGLEHTFIKASSLEFAAQMHGA